MHEMIWLTRFCGIMLGGITLEVAADVGCVLVLVAWAYDAVLGL